MSQNAGEGGERVCVCNHTHVCIHMLMHTQIVKFTYGCFDKINENVYFSMYYYSSLFSKLILL